MRTQTCQLIEVDSYLRGKAWVIVVLNECSQECRICALRLHRVDHVVEILDVSLDGTECLEKGEVTKNGGLDHFLGVRIVILVASYSG